MKRFTTLSRPHLLLALAAIVALLAVPLVALADDVSNNLDASIDAVAEVMSLNVGGANGATQLYIVPRNGDGKQGCNLTGSTTLVISIASSNTLVATVSPAQVIFTSCGDTPTLTVTPHNQGSATISASLVSNNTDGSFNLNPVAFTVNVAPPANTPPQVSIDGVSGGESYLKGSVPAATCQVTDAEDGNSSFAATLSAITGPYASDGIGEQTASCSYTDGGGLTASASMTYGIVDQSAPVIGYVLTPASPDGNNGWYKGNVTLTWNVSDAESPNSVSKTGCEDQDITSDQPETTYSCSATSAGGPAGPVTISIKRDATAPSISANAHPGPNAHGWNNTDVTVSYSCTDNGFSGVDATASNLDDDLLTASGTASGTCVDLAGNSASASYTAQIDKDAPTISASVDPAAAGTGWYNINTGAPKVSFTCGDTGGSGLAESCPAEVTLGEGANQSVSGGPISDLAGNSSGAASISGIDVDLTAPTLTWSDGPADGGSYYFSFVPAVPTCTAADALSGPKDCTVAGYATTVGPHTLTATAHDAAGNSKVETRAYTVLAWTLKGFYQPVDMTPVGGTTVWNTAKNGSTVPLKFELFAGSTKLADTSYVNQPLKATQTPCLGGATDDVELLATGGTSLRYDATAGQFIYNWQTPKKPGYCYQVTVTTTDGSSISASFKLK